MKQGTFVLEIKNLSVQRGENKILHEISWSVKNGEHWVILGANGSGKTSLLSSLTGYLTPTDGEIMVLNQSYGESDWRDLRKHIGLISSSIRQMMAEDECALESVISGKHAIIDFRGRITAADRRQAMKILRQIECEHLANRPWTFLSQGERQRILIGRALMSTPHLLILDEPCAGLDPVAREHFMSFINRLGHKKNAPTLILVTHHLEEIVPCFSKILILKNGKIFASGEKKQLLTSSMLSKAFHTSIHLKKNRTGYQLRIPSKTSSVV